jgi:carboxypeptidase D
LNGGPGCSSLDGLLQENGKTHVTTYRGTFLTLIFRTILWQSGTYAPIANPYSYTNLTNVIYVDQPVSTGFSPGNITINNEHDVAAHFMGFWKNSIDTFSMHGYKVYITGESYAGQYIPYIASGMLDAKDTRYFNVKGVQINDPSINYDSTMIYCKKY